MRGCAGCGRRCLCFAWPSVCAGRPLPYSFFSFLSFFRMRKRENERKSGMLAGCFFMDTLGVFCPMLFFLCFSCISRHLVCTHAWPFATSCCIFCGPCLACCTDCGALLADHLIVMFLLSALCFAVCFCCCGVVAFFLFLFFSFCFSLSPLLHAVLPAVYVCRVHTTVFIHAFLLRAFLTVD